MTDSSALYNPDIIRPIDEAPEQASTDGLWQYYAGFGVSRLATVAILPIVSRIVGPAEFGLFEALFALTLAAMVIGDPGMGSGVVRFVGSNGVEVRRTMRAASAIQIAASLAAFFLFAIPALLVAPPRTSDALVLGALALFTLVEGLGIVGAGILRATERYRAFFVLAWVRLGTAVCIGALGAAIAGATGALYGVALAGLGFAFVGAAPLWRFRRQAITRPIVRRLLRYGVPLIGTSVMVWALSLSDRLFLRALATPAELGAYSASYRLGSVVMLFIAGPLALAWIPVARKARLRSELEALCLYWGVNVAWAALGVGVLVVAASPRLVPAIFGSDFASDNVVVAAVVVSGWLFALYFLLATNILISESTGALAGVSACVVVFNLAANAALISEWGARGAALATLLSYLALAAIAGIVSARGHFPRWVVAPGHVLVMAVLLPLVVIALFYPLPAIFGVAAFSIAMTLGRRRLRHA